MTLHCVCADCRKEFDITDEDQRWLHKHNYQPYRRCVSCRQMRRATAAFEQLATQFYRDTGFIAPGKSVPLEIAATQHDDERRAAWDTWMTTRQQGQSHEQK